jgi:micrococcal nuclease
MRLGRAAVAGGTALVAAAAVVAWLGQGDPPAGQGDAQIELGTSPSAPVGPVDAGWQVNRVVDGDTIRVTRSGERLTVRLIGIDSPESVKPNAPIECFGPEAARFAEDLLDGTEVALERDPAQQATDRYGRTLAYAWLVDSEGNPISLFNIEAIRAGVAREATYDGRYQWQQQFRAAQAQAQQQGRGLWGACDAG